MKLFNFSFRKLGIKLLVLIITVALGFLYQMSLGYTSSIVYDYSKSFWDYFWILPLVAISIIGFLHTVNKLSWMYRIWKTALWIALIAGIVLEYLWFYR